MERAILGKGPYRSTMQEHTDAELVVLARTGEAEAFVHLMERYRLIASAVALRHLPDREYVRDIVQEAILQAYLSLDHLRDPARFKSWFYAIVVNTCRMWLRRQPLPGRFAGRPRSRPGRRCGP